MNLFQMIAEHRRLKKLREEKEAHSRREVLRFYRDVIQQPPPVAILTWAFGGGEDAGDLMQAFAETRKRMDEAGYRIPDFKPAGEGEGNA